MTLVRTALGMPPPTPPRWADPERQSLKTQLDDAELRLKLMDEYADAMVATRAARPRRRRLDPR